MITAAAAVWADCKFSCQECLNFSWPSSSTKIITLNTNTREILIWGGLHTSSLSNYAIFPKPLITQGCLINLANPSLSQFAAINRSLYKMLLWLLCDCTRLGSIPGTRSGILIIWGGLIVLIIGSNLLWLGRDLEEKPEDGIVQRSVFPDIGLNSWAI